MSRLQKYRLEHYIAMSASMWLMFAIVVHSLLSGKYFWSILGAFGMLVAFLMLTVVFIDANWGGR